MCFERAGVRSRDVAEISGKLTKSLVTGQTPDPGFGNASWQPRNLIRRSCGESEGDVVDAFEFPRVALRPTTFRIREARKAMHRCLRYLAGREVNRSISRTPI
ncbi:hypothetical protein KM043_000471 [Ampulex compressa]|nr:hypothetical protein KM043_000471 [Ampulex compressa]